MWIAGLASMGFKGCQLPFFQKETQTDERVLAKAYNQTFTLAQLREMIPAGTPPRDSVQMAKNFIDTWIREQVILHLAEKNLPDHMKQVQQQLEEYRKSLIMYIYESELIRQHLDTTVSEEEIINYYNENPQNFELKDNIVKATYVIVKQNAPKLNKLRGWFHSASTKDKKLLNDYCYQFATAFRLDDENWILFDELAKAVPIKTYDQEHFLRNNRLLEIADSAYYYLIRIHDFKIKESLSPLEFERENIRSLILNKRKLQLIKQLEKQAIQQALDKREVVFFIPND
jgi:hypothetical protein